MSIMLQIPVPPSANRLWTRTRTGMCKSTEYCNWLTEAGWKVKAQHPKAIHGPYKLSIKVAKSTCGKHCDLDNLIKPTNDLLQQLRLIEDDKLCQKVSAEWVAGIGVTVLVEPMEAA